MENLLRGREAAQNILIYRNIVTTQRLTKRPHAVWTHARAGCKPRGLNNRVKIMLFLPHFPACSLRPPPESDSLLARIFHENRGVELFFL